MQIERYIAHDGKNIEYLKYEHNNGDNCKKIVLLHGMFESIELYTDFAQYFFYTGYDVYIPEYRGNGKLREKEYTDFGEDRIDGVLEDLNIFIHDIFANVNYRDIILIGQGIGALLVTYLSINNKFKNILLSSMFMESRIVLNMNLAIAKIEDKFNKAESKLNSYYKLNFNKITNDPSVIKKLKENEEYIRLASPKYYIDIFRLLKYIKKNMKKIREDINILMVYGGSDEDINNEKLKKYLTTINNKLRDIKILKNEKGRKNNLLEINKKQVYNKIENWLKNIK